MLKIYSSIRKIFILSILLAAAGLLAREACVAQTAQILNVRPRNGGVNIHLIKGFPVPEHWNEIHNTTFLLVPQLLLWNAIGGGSASGNVQFVLYPQEPVPQKQSSVGEANSLLWEISGNGLEQPSYLYGTIHVIGKSDFVVSDLVMEKFKSVKKLALEIKTDAPDLQLKMMQSMMMGEDTTLQMLLGEDYETVSRFMQDSLALNLQLFATIKPLFIQALTLPKIIGEPIEAYDFYFAKLAQEEEKEIVGLETIDDQIKVFDGIPLKEQANMLVEFANDYSAQKALFHKMIDLYKAQDIRGLHQCMLQQPEYEKYEELLINQRNRNWIAVIKKLIQPEKIFIAVGAGHLPGEQGVIRLLEQEGYVLKPL